jgi:hypothetical protein
MELIQTQTAEIVTEPSADLLLRQCVIEGLALAVPEFMSRAQAAEQVASYFPEDQLAVRSLHKQISKNLQPVAA